MRLLTLARQGLLLLCGIPLFAWATSWQDGDLIFQTSRSSQSSAVQIATGSRYSHMGMLVQQRGEWQVLEAAATVRYTPLADWLARGVGGHAVIKRLRTPLTPAQQASLRAAIPTYLGKPYDLTFRWSDHRIYCSELVWKLYQRTLGIRIGPLQKVRDFRLADPRIQAQLRARYGEQLPLDEPVVSPGAMFDDAQLQTVMKR